jgi:hypothetical protein
MPKIKLYIYIAVAGLIMGLSVTLYFERKGRIREKADRIRLQENQRQLMLQDSLKFVHLVQSFDEFKKAISPKIDSILKAGKIKPKQVTNIVEKHYFYRDTSYQAHTPAPVETDKGTIFPFTDIKDCFRIDGFMTIDKQQPSLMITKRQFENTSIDIAYVEREKHIWFIRYGKWKARLKQVNKCGESTTKEIEIIKNKRD